MLSKKKYGLSFGLSQKEYVPIAGYEPFSASELRVVEQLARGLSEKEIANVLHLSIYTVKNHLRNICERNHIQKNTEIIILYAVSLSKRVTSVREVKELGFSILFMFLNVCGYTQIIV